MHPILEMLAARLSGADLDALARPLLLDKLGAPVNYETLIAGLAAQGKAFLDPSAYFKGGRPFERIPMDDRNVILSLDQREQAEKHTLALYRMLQILTGHDGVAVTTFKECGIFSRGIFPWWKGQFVGIYKEQPFIGRGKQKFRIGRAGAFILPHERQLIADVTVAQVAKQMPFGMSKNRLRKFGPDHVIEKLDYDMTWRARNYGIVFSYDVELTEADWAALTAGNVTVLDGNAPHPNDDVLREWGKDGGRVLRLMTREDMIRIEEERMLTLEAEMPRLMEMMAA